MLFAVLAVISVVVAGYFLYSFQNSQTSDSSSSLIIGIVFALLAVVFGGLFMFNRVNQHEDIHITE